jgi:hypothetical protein
MHPVKSDASITPRVGHEQGSKDVEATEPYPSPVGGRVTKLVHQTKKRPAEAGRSV